MEKMPSISSQNNFLVRAWLPGFFIPQRWGWGKVRKPRLFSPANVPWNGKPQAGGCASLACCPSQVGGQLRLSPEAGHYVGLITKRVKVTETDAT